MNIAFLLNGRNLALSGIDPSTTVLDWLRDTQGLTATKEGCNEGDCGACTVLLTDAQGTRAVNACVLFMGQLQGRALRTVEGLRGPDGTPHPVQQAMVDHHGSQCGFCTPGFIAQMAANHLHGETRHETGLSGNLCRCTGYAPILRAARAAETAPIPDWMRTDAAILAQGFSGSQIPPGGQGGSAPLSAHHPATSDDLAALYAAHPDATLVAGATDVGLWVTKQHRSLSRMIFLSGLRDLAQITEDDSTITIGAGVTIARLIPLMHRLHPSFAAMLRRYGSPQVRAVATIGGNIANGSPIGDTPPALIALGATLHLRHGDTTRHLPLEDFFLAYGRQDRRPGEFVTAVTIPRQPDHLRVYKVSKRFDQDISAICGAFDIRLAAGRVTAARIAFGGMAGIPQRAARVEAALTGQPWDSDTLDRACADFAQDYTPLSDMRASAAYRLTVAANLLRRYHAETAGLATDPRAVTP